MIYLLVPLLFVSVSFFTYDPINIVSSCVLILVAALMLLFQKKFQYLKSIFIILPLLLPVSYLISGLINSQSLYSIFAGGYQRNFGVATFAALGFIFLIATQPRTNLINFTNSLLIALIIANIYGHMQIVGIDPLPWTGIHEGIILTLGNPNFAGAFLGILSCVPLVKFFQTKAKYMKAALIILFVSTIFLGFQSNAVQSQLLSILGCLIVINVLQIDNQRVTGKILRTFSSVAVLLSIAFTTLIFSTDLFSNFKLQIFTQSSVSQRLDYWRTGIEIFLDNPIIGVGPDEYHRYAAVYRSAQQVTRDGYMAIPDKAHNVFIDHFANGGLITGILWLFFVLSVFYAGIKVIKSISNINKFNIAILFSVWSTYVFQAIISPDQIVLTAIGFASGGLIVGMYLANTYQQSVNLAVGKSTLLWNRFFSSFLVVLALLFISKSLWYDSQANKIIQAQLIDPTKILNTINSNFASAKTVELIGIMKIKENASCDFIDEISSRLLEIDDRSSQAWFMKAICANREKNYKTAQEYVERSLKFDPLNVDYLLGKAELEIFQMEKLNASKTLDKIRSINPSDPQLLQLRALLK